MAGAESTLTIRARDDTGGAFASVEQRIKAVDAQLNNAMKTFDGIGRVDGGVGSLSSSIERATRSIAAASNATVGLRGELARLGEAQAKIAAFRSMGDGFAKARANFNATRLEVEKLGVAMKATEAPTQAMRAAYDKAEAASWRAEAAFQKQRSALTTLKGEIEGVIGPLSSLSSAESRIAGEIERVTSALSAQGVAAERAASRVRGAEAAAAAAAREREYWAQRQRDGRTGAQAPGVGSPLWLAAPFALHEFKAAVESGEDVERARVALRAANVPESEIAEVDRQAAALGGQYPNVKRSDILKRYQEGRSMMRDPAEMLQFLPDIVRAESALNAYDPTGRLGDSLKYVMKGAEAQSLAQKPEEFRRNLNESVKALQVLGATVEPEQLFDFARNMKGEAPFVSDRFRYRVAPSLIQEMTGASAGKALSQFSQDIIVGFSHRKDAAALALKMGLVKRGDLLFDKTGNPRGLKPGRYIKDYQLAMSDPDEWLYKDVLPSLAGKSDVEKEAALDQLFGHSTVSGLLNKLMIQQQTIQAHGAQTDAALGVGAVDVYRGDPGVALASLTTSISNLAAAATSPAMQDAARVMSAVAASFGGLAAQLDAWQRAHPQAARVGSEATIGALVGGGIWGAWKAIGGVWGKLFGAAGDIGPALGRIPPPSASFARYPGMVAPAASGLLGVAGRLLGAVSWPLLLHDIGELANPTTPAGAPYRVDTAWPSQREDMERATRAEVLLRQGSDMEPARGRALGALSDAPMRVQLDPNSKVIVEVNVRALDGSILKLVADAVARATGNAAASVGTSTAGVAPNGVRGGWDR